LQQGNYTAARAAANDVLKIVVTAYLINMQMPLTMILTNRKTYLLFKLRNKPGTIKLPIIMLRKTMEVAVVISKSEITILINSQTQMMRRNFNYLNPANNQYNKLKTIVGIIRLAEMYLIIDGN
jgi:hypothetical protein